MNKEQIANTISSVATAMHTRDFKLLSTLVTQLSSVVEKIESVEVALEEATGMLLRNGYPVIDGFVLDLDSGLEECNVIVPEDFFPNFELDLDQSYLISTMVTKVCESSGINLQDFIENTPCSENGEHKVINFICANDSENCFYVLVG